MNQTINMIGVDLGGTNIRAGKIIDQRLVQMHSKLTPAQGTEAEVLEKLFDVIDQCVDNSTKGIGIGVPSIVDVAKGIVYDVVNIPSWKEVPLKDILEARYKIPVYINNDANCFALGEKYFGKAKGFRNVVGLTIGTGLGCGLIFNDKLYEGQNCCAGEFGFIRYLNSDFESYCSGQFFEAHKSITALEAYNLAVQGDESAKQMYAEYGQHLGKVIQSLLYAYDPQVIVLGGSLSKAGQFFWPSMVEAINGFAYKSVLSQLHIEISDLEHAAIYGAAALCLHV